MDFDPADIPILFHVRGPTDPMSSKDDSVKAWNVPATIEIIKQCIEVL